MQIFNTGMLKTEMASGKTRNIYFLFGNDAYLKKQLADKLIDATAERSDVFNYMFFDGNCSLSDVYDAVLQFPMMVDKKCVVLNDFDFEKADKSNFSTLCEIIQSVPNTTVFIIWCNDFEFNIKKSDRAQKTVAQVEKFGGAAVEINHMSQSELKRMLSAGASKRNLILQSSTAQYLIDNCGEDINKLKNELEKLCSYAAANKITEISKQMIDSVTVKSFDASVFELSKKIFAMNSSEAIRLLDELFYMKTESAIILHSIFTSFIDAYRVFTGEMSGIKISQIASDFSYGSRKFVLPQVKSATMKMDSKRFRLCFEEILAADSAIKSFSGSERTVIEELVVKLIYIISKGAKIDKD